MAPARKRATSRKKTTKRTKTAKKGGRKTAPKAARKTARKTTKRTAKKSAGRKKTTKKAAAPAGAPKPAGDIPLKNRQGKAVKKSDTFSKSDLVEHVARANPDLPKTQARKVVNDVFDTMDAALKKCDKATITGFGSFNKKKIPARKGGKMVTNPFTGEKVRQKARPARLKINFRPSPGLKKL